LIDAFEVETNGFVGTAVAERMSSPCWVGFHEQVATIFGVDPDVGRFLQPTITLPFNLKVTFEAVERFAVITTGVRYGVVVTDPASENELKDEIVFRDPGPAGGKT
jgi:hypothetical protein